jgi:amino acid transporter
LLLAYLTISNGSGFISWLCCSIIYFCFDMACKVRGLKKLYTSKIQLYRMDACQPSWRAHAGSAQWVTMFSLLEWSTSNIFTVYIAVHVF